jgi:hypothetical protein
MSNTNDSSGRLSRSAFLLLVPTPSGTFSPLFTLANILIVLGVWVHTCTSASSRFAALSAHIVKLTKIHCNYILEFDPRRIVLPGRDSYVESPHSWSSVVIIPVFTLATFQNYYCLNRMSSCDALKKWECENARRHGLPKRPLNSPMFLQAGRRSPQIVNRSSLSIYFSTFAVFSDVDLRHFVPCGNAHCFLFHMN